MMESSALHLKKLKANWFKYLLKVTHGDSKQSGKK